MDSIDRQIINSLQGGFPVCDHPFAKAANSLGLGEDILIERIDRLLDEGYLTRFGPMFNIERSGGSYSLCAMAVPPNELEKIAAQINQYPQIAHNYEREHDYNLWFVIATETPEEIATILAQIEQETDYAVMNLPKEDEFYVGLYFDV